ncbi:MAG: AAA family ATPase [Planctomycetaceae bacterium]|nr:AAA family ATPase [Planctomycetaceae bacterium]
MIEGFWIRNYKAVRQIAVGSSFQQSVVMDAETDIVPYELTPLTVFIGESGAGKSCILDAFCFIADILEYGLDEAFVRRGGVNAVYHASGEGPIAFGIVFRSCAADAPLTYILNINKKPNTQQAFIETEAVLYRNTDNKQPRPILFFQNGEKYARHLQPWYNASGSQLEQVKGINEKTLALGVLARFEDLPDIPQFKQYLSRYFVTSFISSNAAALSPPKFKFSQVENLANELRRLKEKHSREFSDILNIIGRQIPGVERLEYKLLESGRNILAFYYQGSNEPVFTPQLGESVLRLLALLTLFEDPVPSRLVGIEEPSASMGRAHVMSFVAALHRNIREIGGTQFFMTTHSNVLIDQMDPTEVWLLYKDSSGNIQASRCLDELQFQGIDLNTVGPYWWTDHLYRVPR